MSDVIRRLAFQLGSKPPVVPKPYSPKGSVIIAGHESPHKFDQYSLDHMGKGEGAQAYSKGIYLWEEPAVGRHYHSKFQRPGWDQDTFFKPPDDEIQNYHEDGIWADQLKALERMHRDGKLPLDVLRHRGSGNIKAAGAELEHWAQRQLVGRYGDESKARAWVNAEYGSTSDPTLGVRFQGMPSIKQHQRLLQEDEALGLLAGWFNGEHNAFRADDFINPPGGVPGSPGFTYHTKIHADRRDLPLYTQRIDRQEPHVRRALLDIIANNHGLFRGVINPSGVTPRQMEFAMTARRAEPSGNHHPALGQFESALLDRGIPGVRYDDGLSRSATAKGQGTQNFVIYDPKYLEIVKRYPYSIAGPLLAPALTSPADTDRR